MIEVRPKSLLQAQRFPSEMRYATRSNDRYPTIAAIQISGALAFAASASGMGVRLSTPMLSSIRDKPHSADNFGSPAIGTWGPLG